MNFHVGQKVVCVDASPDVFGRAVRLTKGTVYTVAQNQNGVPGVFIEEAEPNYQYGFRPSRFRPVKTTDISIFRKMLVPTEGKQKESV